MEDPKTATPGERLEHWIKEKFGGWGSKSRCAEALGMQSAQLSKYINNQMSPGPEIRAKLARLGLNLHWYEVGEGPMIAPTKSPKEVYPSELGPSGKIVGTVKAIVVNGQIVHIISGLDSPHLPDAASDESQEKK